MYSKDNAVVQPSPLTGGVPGPAGDLIGLRVAARPDHGCDVELVPSTYDCTAAMPNDLYVRCELTPGASSNVDADIERIAGSFRSHFKF
jgi:hypothetical protein